MKRIVLCAVLNLGFLAAAGAQGFLLSPDRAIFTEVEPGKQVDSLTCGTVFKIINKSPQKRVYTVEIKKAKDINRKLMLGYAELPDAGFILTPKKFEVEGNSDKIIPLSFSLPGAEGFYNRKFQAELIVREGEGNIGIELAGDLFLETKGKTIREKLSFSKGDAEEYLLAPATLLAGGFSSAKTVYLHNTGKTPLTFLMVSESPPAQVVDMFIPLAPGYERLPDESWVEPVVKDEEKLRRLKKGKEIQPQKKIELAPGEIKEIEIKINIPRNKEFEGKKYESYIFIRSPKLDRTRFIRIRTGGGR